MISSSRLRTFAIFFLVLLQGCGGGYKTTKSKLVISLSSLVSSGGNTYSKLALRLVNTSTGGVTDYILTDSNIVELPRGTWNFYLVTFTQTANYIKCGSTSGVALNQDAQTVNITVTATCTDPQYDSIITAAAGRWDSAILDTDTFAP